MHIEFKTQRIEDEWTDKQLDKRLKVILYLVMGIVGELYGYGNYILITDINRTDPEQIKIYGGKMPKSGNIHGCWRAIDFVIKDAFGQNWGVDLCKSVTKLFNSLIKYNKEDRYKTFVFHSVQVGDKGHFHEQVSWKNQTLIRR